MDDSHLMIQHKKLTIFTNVSEKIPVHELKKIIAGIIKVPPENQQLFHNGLIMENTNTLSSYGVSSINAKAYSPATIGLALKMESGEFEPLEITAYSSPPDLLTAMKNLETNDRHSPI